MNKEDIQKIYEKIEKEIKSREKQAEKFNIDLKNCELPESESFENYHESFQSGLINAKYIIEKITGVKEK